MFLLDLLITCMLFMPCGMRIVYIVCFTSWLNKVTILRHSNVYLSGLSLTGTVVGVTHLKSSPVLIHNCTNRAPLQGPERGDDLLMTARVTQWVG
jgi:hypothetical protein